MQDEPKLTLLGKFVVFVFIAGCLYGTYYFFLQGSATPPDPAAVTGVKPAGQLPNARPIPDAEKVAFGIAYGTEKDRWLKWAVEEFAKTPQGAGVKIKLMGKGSIDSANAIKAEDKDINVWCPASSLERERLESDWIVLHGKTPIVRGESLALTPLVFVMPAERERKFVQRYKVVSFDTLFEALQEKGGWNGIAGEELDWGYFKLGHTNPGKSNSGLLTLTLMAYNYHKKAKGLAKKDVTDPGFQAWLRKFEAAVQRPLLDSTGTMMKDLAAFGVSRYDAVVVYENVAIDYLEAARGRGIDLRVHYPKYTIWSDNPYYILDVPWSSPAQRKAAEAFLALLLTPDVQQQSLRHGFRPGNLDVKIVGVPDSPFDKDAALKDGERTGLKLQGFQLCETPPTAVLSELLTGWYRLGASE